MRIWWCSPRSTIRRRAARARAVSQEPQLGAGPPRRNRAPGVDQLEQTRPVLQASDRDSDRGVFGSREVLIGFRQGHPSLISHRRRAGAAGSTPLAMNVDLRAVISGGLELERQRPRRLTIASARKSNVGCAGPGAVSNQRQSPARPEHHRRTRAAQGADGRIRVVPQVMTYTRSTSSWWCLSQRRRLACDGTCSSHRAAKKGDARSASRGEGRPQASRWTSEPSGWWTRCANEAPPRDSTRISRSRRQAANSEGSPSPAAGHSCAVFGKIRRLDRRQVGKMR